MLPWEPDGKRASLLGVGVGHLMSIKKEAKGTRLQGASSARNRDGALQGRQVHTVGSQVGIEAVSQAWGKDRIG